MCDGFATEPPFPYVLDPAIRLVILPRDGIARANERKFKYWKSYPMACRKYVREFSGRAVDADTSKRSRFE